MDYYQKHRDWVLDPLSYHSVVQLVRVFRKGVLEPANERRRVLIAKKAEELMMRDANELEGDRDEENRLARC